MTILCNWTIDGQPAPESVLFQADALMSIGPLHVRVVNNEYLKAYFFEVSLRGGRGLLCTRVSKDNQLLEVQRQAVQRFRDELVIAWGDSKRAEVLLHEVLQVDDLPPALADRIRATLTNLNLKVGP